MKPVSYLCVPTLNGYVRYAVLGFFRDKYIIRLENGWYHTQLVGQDWIDSMKAVFQWEL